MAESTGIILATAGIAAANEAIFAPAVAGQALWVNFNWRIIPAAGIAALMLAGIEQVSPPFGKGLAYLALMSVLFFPVGNAPSPVDNATKLLGIK